MDLPRNETRCTDGVGGCDACGAECPTGDAAELTTDQTFEFRVREAGSHALRLRIRPASNGLVDSVIPPGRGLRLRGRAA